MNIAQLALTEEQLKLLLQMMQTVKDMDDYYLLRTEKNREDYYMLQTTLESALERIEEIPLCYYVNVYFQDRAYGGPEEGGWYYDTIECVQCTPSRECAGSARRARPPCAPRDFAYPLQAY